MICVTNRLQYLYHSHKKWKNGLETRDVLLTFLLELEIYGVAAQRIHQNSKKWLLSVEGFLSRDDYGAALAIFCCYDYNANASEAVGKIGTDEKYYYKRLLCVIVCCIATTYQ